MSEQCIPGNSVCLQLCPDTLPVVPAVLLGVLGVSGQGSSHGELVLKDSTGGIICEVREVCICLVMYTIYV